MKDKNIGGGMRDMARGMKNAGMRVGNMVLLVGLLVGLGLLFEVFNVSGRIDGAGPFSSILNEGIAIAAGPGGAPGVGQAEVVVTDDFGRKVTVQGRPMRIISLAPSNTEILFALGLGDRVVGVTNYCNYPPEAKLKEKIGGFSNPSIEKIIALKPDLVLATGMHQGLIKELERLKIPVIVLYPKTVAEVVRAIEVVGEATGARKAAQELAKSMEERIQRVTSKVKNIPIAKRPKVYYELWHDPLMTCGPGTFIDDIISLAGGVNIASDAGKEYPEYSLEVLLAKNPDIMLHSYGHGSSGVPAVEEIRKRRGWEGLSFVKNGRIYLVDADLLNRPGPRIVDGLEAVARIVHPELFR